MDNEVPDPQRRGSRSAMPPFPIHLSLTSSNLDSERPERSGRCLCDCMGACSGRDGEEGWSILI